MDTYGVVPLFGETREEALEILRLEFFQSRKPEEYRARYTSLLEVGGDAVRENPKSNRRGAELFGILGRKSPTGVLLIHYFDWELLAPQVYLAVAEANDEKLVALRLAKLHQIVPKEVNARLAMELAYFWVGETLRGQGLGRLLFEFFLDRAAAILSEGDFVFTLQLGSLGYTDLGQKVQAYMLQREETVNGKNEETGLVNITGLVIPVEEIKVGVGIDLRRILPHPKAIATGILAQKFGMEFLGFSKNLGRLFGKAWISSTYKSGAAEPAPPLFFLPCVKLSSRDEHEENQTVFLEKIL